MSPLLFERTVPWLRVFFTVLGALLRSTLFLVFVLFTRLLFTLFEVAVLLVGALPEVLLLLRVVLRSAVAAPLLFVLLLRVVVLLLLLERIGPSFLVLLLLTEVLERVLLFLVLFEAIIVFFLFES